MREFLDEINASPWKGAISEAGIGLDFSYQFVSHPGATKTIIDINSPYGSFVFDGRKVSREAAEELATSAFNFAATTEGTVHNIFGFSMTGAHYQDKDTHAWACLKTKKFTAYIHYSIPTNPDRKTVGAISTRVLTWFIEGCLLPKRSWQQHLGFRPTGAEIDVLYAPGVSDFERLSLLSPTTVLGYNNGQFVRVVDLLRKYDTIYGGAFNPPHDGHVAIASDCLLELSQSNFTKGYASTEDMLHRINMINILGLPLILTQEPLFLRKDKLFKRYVDKTYKYRMGADAWNMFVDHLFSSAAASEMVFEVYQRGGYYPKKVPNIDVTFMDEVMDISSTDIRENEDDT